MSGPQIGPGVYPDLTADQYHEDPCITPSLSSGILRTLLNRTPAHAYAAHPRLGGGDDDRGTRRTAIGSAAHRLILGRGADVLVIAADAYRTNAAKAERDDAIRNGLIPILAHEWAEVQAMAGPGREALESVVPGAEPPRCEVVIVWQDCGVLCRAMLDAVWIEAGICVDYKTVSDGSPDTFGRHLYAQDYDLQRAFYMRGMRAVGMHEPRFILLAQELDGAHLCSLHEPDAHSTELADREVERGLMRWAECLKSGVWPDYGRAIHQPRMPAWKAQRIELNELEAMQ